MCLGKGSGCVWKKEKLLQSKSSKILTPFSHCYPSLYPQDPTDGAEISARLRKCQKRKGGNTKGKIWMARTTWNMEKHTKGKLILIFFFPPPCKPGFDQHSHCGSSQIRFLLTSSSKPPSPPLDSNPLYTQAAFN